MNDNKHQICTNCVMDTTDSKIIFDEDGIYAIEWGAYGVPETFIIYNNITNLIKICRLRSPMFTETPSITPLT